LIGGTAVASGKIEVENVMSPGKIYRVDLGIFLSMREAVLKVLPAAPPGMTPAEIQRAVLPHLPTELFPGGERAGWWMKSAKLDLEPKASSHARQKRP
jgi:hypothetical protein